MSNRSLTLKPTNEELSKRRTALLTIQEDLNNKYEDTPKKLIIDMMKEGGIYENYNYDMLRVDELNLKAKDTFVSDLAIYTYSRTIREMFEDLDEVKREAKLNFKSEKGFIRINSMKIVVDVVGMKEKILSGKALDVSVELLGKKWRAYIEEQKQLEHKPPK